MIYLKETNLSVLCIILFAWLLTGCEKAVLEEEGAEQKEATSTAKAKGNLILCVSELESQSFQTITKSSDSECPTHLCFAIYDMAGTRIKQVNQTSDMADLGHVSLSLEKGTYQLVVLAHSSIKNPTLTDLSKVQFNNSTGYTDTFLCYSEVTIGEDTVNYEVSLDRICALCRFVISDSIPDGVTQIKFQYNGGSGHFSALTGLGVTNSTQVVTRQVQPGQQYQVFDLYTFLHQEEGSIELTATALTAAGKEYRIWEFSVPMRKNQITWFTGNFFSEEPTSTRWLVTPNIALDKTWASELFYTY